MIGVKTNMKKHDEKKQGTVESVSSRKCVNEKEKKKSKKREKKTRQAQKPFPPPQRTNTGRRDMQQD